MVHVSGKLDGILGALNLETSFIHHTVIYVISSANLKQFAIPLSFFCFALGPNCTATSHKGNILEMVQMMPPSCFQAYSLHSVVTTLKKGFTLEKSNMKMTSWKITIFFQGDTSSNGGCSIGMFVFGGCIFLKLLGNIPLWTLASIYFPLLEAIN